MQPKISIVVAAYNVEKYLKKCLDSLICQSLKEIEIIIVNDGSNDKTENIISEYKLKDSRIKSITKENGGLSDARNTGIKNASANYIAFIDADDYVDSMMYEKLYKVICEKNSDLAICGFFKVWESKQKIFLPNEKLIRGNHLNNFISHHDETFVVAWNKLFKKSIIDEGEIYFQNKRFFEDVGFIPRYLYYCKSISLVKEPLYYYLQREGSITQSSGYNIDKSATNTLSVLNEFFERKGRKINLNPLKLRLYIYILNYNIHNQDQFLKFKKEILYLEKYSKLLPQKHRVAIIFLKLGIYKVLFTRLKGE
ncbi:glycosyltransferase family 2 protein [Peribacillus muralis]|uniref:glycosyltransferase family 2 protein n=1 Tax=Peribacillus muralis TaxID=264697 RepID=UPI00366EB454